MRLSWWGVVLRSKRSPVGFPARQGRRVPGPRPVPGWADVPPRSSLKINNISEKKERKEKEMGKSEQTLADCNSDLLSSTKPRQN